MTGPQISVTGSADADPAATRAAHRVGRELGRHDAVLVCGGGGGVMEAACRGVHETGGTTLGILKGRDFTFGNAHLDVCLPTGVGHARNLMVALAGQAMIAVDGALGTLTELAFALKFNRPVYGVGSWDHPRLPFDHDLTPREAVRRALTAAE